MRAGAAAVDPREDSGALKVGGAALAGTGVGLDSDTQLGLTVAWMVTSNIGIELLAATPFEHDIAARGLSGLGIDSVGSTRHLPPTLSVQYYPLDAGSAFQPYVGIGLNYTTFFSEKLSGEVKTVLGGSNLDIDDSVGMAFQLGADWRINERWLVNAAVWRIDIETTVTLDSALGRVKVELDIDPWVYMVGVGYKF